MTKERKVFIISKNFLDYENMETLLIGGVQTYIDNLIPLILECGMEPIVIQYSNYDKCVKYKGIDVYGVNIQGVKPKTRKKLLYQKYKKLNLEDNNILLYAAELDVYKKDKAYTMAIQHGIEWDVQDDGEINKIKSLITFIKKVALSFSRIKLCSHLDYLVCVDYNFINWFRTLSRYKLRNYRCIPNFSEVSDEIPQKEKDIVNIIFARRFVDFRGTILFAEAVKEVLDSYKNVFVTIAGTGPDENKMREILKDYDNVSFIKYHSEDSQKIHSDKHIAVVPTKGSEGTSLSLLEAMASGCAVIATNVGGMTNIVIDGYNGRLINPDVEELKNAMKELIEDTQKREFLASNAYNSVKYGFSHTIWRKKWRSVFEEIEGCLEEGEPV